VAKGSVCIGPSQIGSGGPREAATDRLV